MRRRKQLIKSLQKGNGDIITKINELEDITTLFYPELYTSEGVNNMQEVMDSVTVEVTVAMNVSLNVAYSRDGVKTVLF